MSFLNKIGNPRVFGLTATPYRQDIFYERTDFGELLTHTTTKLINRMKERFWHRILFNIDIQDLIDQGFLVPLKYLDRPIISHRQIPTNISKSDFNLEAYEEIIAKKSDIILESIFFGMELSKSVLVFCSSVRQAEWLADTVPGSAAVSAKTPKKERKKVVDDFKSGKIQTVFNVGVFTVGFDHPGLGCIVLLRPTKSIALYQQMIGRGVRPSPGKSFCRVIDLTGTVKELGRIETFKLIKRDQWELESEMGSWHKKPLYSFLIKED
jgi:DNA repair protein RadD